MPGQLLLLGRLGVPGISTWSDVPHVAGLIPPRPLVIEMGVQGSGLFQRLRGGATGGFDPLKRIYDAAGAGEGLWQDVHPGVPAFANNQAHEFVGKYL
jgi:hypothetical protein